MKYNDTVTDHYQGPDEEVVETSSDTAGSH